MSEPPSPLDELAATFAAALAARRRDALGPVERAEAALAAYRRALEQRVAYEFASDHKLRAPQPSGATLARAAEELRAALLGLPELGLLEHRARGKEPAEAASAGGGTNPAAPDSAPAPASPGLPRLRALLATRKLVIVGALSHRERADALPAGINEHTEWIDTERDGQHALGNLPQRIRQGRVAALVILDRAIKHKHSEPALAAARDARVAHAFGGQGGRLSLLRALEQIESWLGAQA
jgi:hypothetical protein